MTSVKDARNAARRARYAEDEAYAERERANARVQEAKRDPVTETVRKRVQRLADPRRLEKRKAEQAKVRRDVIEGYGGECVCCGDSYLPHLTIDHINGGGADERRQTCGRSILRRLRREGFPPGYQILCWNCNMTKFHLGRCGCQDATH
jgi:hypothetical protein